MRTGIAGRSGEPLPHHAGPPDPALEQDETPRTPRTIWPLAVLGAVLIHAGCAALAYDYLQPDDASDDLDVPPAIEIGLEVTAPHHDPSELPPGPDAEASAASPPVAEQKAAVEQTELPKATPTETEDPDRVVTPNDPKKPEDDDPKTETVQTAPSNPSVAAEATAMPSPQIAEEAPRSVAPEQGSGESLRRARKTWEQKLAIHLAKYKRYPGNRTSLAADIVVDLVLDRTGHVVSAHIAKSSGDAAFDEAALAMMRRADPVPAPPPTVADEGLSFSMPVNFHGRTGR